MKNFLFLMFLGLSMHAYGQKTIYKEDNPSWKERIYFGGGVGFSSSSYSSYLSLSPTVGYMLTPKLSAGVGATYQYYKDKVYDAEDHRYGGNVFLMQMLIYRVFVMGQYSFINMNRNPRNENWPRETFTRFLLGGGLSQPLGKAFLNITAMYDVLYDSTDYPYSSPWVIGAFISI